MKLAELCPLALPVDLNLPHEVFIGENVLNELPGVIERYLGDDFLCVADPDTLQACRKTLPYPIYILPKHPHAEFKFVEHVCREAEHKSGLVAIGGGTVNDICKMASTLLKIPYIVIGTAASMNGYASGIAAILDNGLKTTRNAVPPRAILLDIDILMEAPIELAQAGLGDLLSKSVSTADYWLSDYLEQSGFDLLPGQIVDAALGELTDKSTGLIHRDKESYYLLAKALVLSGVSMVAAGSSSPASGGEHLISHFWDMEALIEGKAVRLHGAQVGVASCICAAIYQKLLALEQPEFINPPAWETEENRIKRDHGKLADTVARQARRKNARARERIDILRHNWHDIQKQLAAMNLPKPDVLRGILCSIDAPYTLNNLNFSKEYALRTLRLARDIRDRITVLDIAFETGLFPGAIEQVLEDSGTIS